MKEVKTDRPQYTMKIRIGIQLAIVTFMGLMISAVSYMVTNAFEQGWLFYLVIGAYVLVVSWYCYHVKGNKVLIYQDFLEHRGRNWSETVWFEEVDEVEFKEVSENSAGDVGIGVSVAYMIVKDEEGNVLLKLSKRSYTKEDIHYLVEEIRRKCSGVVIKGLDR